MRRRSVLLACVLLLAAMVARAEEVAVIPLKYRTVDQVLPIVRELLQPGEAATGTQGTLVIRGSAASVERLRQVVASIDTMPRRLMITVRQGAAGSSITSEAGASTTIGTGDARVGVGERQRSESGARVRIQESTASVDDRFATRVQTLEGSPAFISLGQSVPVGTPEVVATPGGYGGYVVPGAPVIQELTSGVYVVPRVTGNRVILEISPQRATPGPYGPGSAQSQQIATTASGRLGEWFELGSIAQSGARAQSGILYGGASGSSVSSSVWVRVDEIK